jgi:hypothetical protein
MGSELVLHSFRMSLLDNACWVRRGWLVVWPVCGWFVSVRLRTRTRPAGTRPAALDQGLDKPDKLGTDNPPQLALQFGSSFITAHMVGRVSAGVLRWRLASPLLRWQKRFWQFRGWP